MPSAAAARRWCSAASSRPPEVPLLPRTIMFRPELSLVRAGGMFQGHVPVGCVRALRPGWHHGWAPRRYALPPTLRPPAPSVPSAARLLGGRGRHFRACGRGPSVPAPECRLFPICPIGRPTSTFGCPRSDLGFSLFPRQNSDLIFFPGARRGGVRSAPQAGAGRETTTAVKRVRGRREGARLRSTIKRLLCHYCDKQTD